MKITNIKEVDGFLAALNKCKGYVWLETASGDRLNLKSRFARYIALGELLQDYNESLELFCAMREDEQYFYEYFNEFPGVN